MSRKDAEAQRKNAKKLFMREHEVAREIVDAAYKIHTRLGAGLLESVYEAVMAYELKSVEIVAPVHKKQLLTY